MDVISLTVTGEKLTIQRPANLGEMRLKPLDCVAVKNLPPIFRNENKVADQFADRVSFLTIIRE
jgi:hypothetical protein